MLRLIHNTHFDFIRHWKTAAIVTGLFILIGMGMLAKHKADYGSAVNWNVEFTGGTFMQLKFAKEQEAGAVREAVSAAGYEAEVAQFGDKTEYTVRAGAAGQEATVASADSTSTKIESALRAKFGDSTNVKVVRSEFVGPRVGAELTRNAMIAILVSFLVTMIYLAMRFEWRFGLAAILATAHDLVATLAFIAMLRLEVSLTVVAAILTVIGYSLNDTIIIFDRIRENLKKHRKEPLFDIVNRSVNETLPRSILTHATTMAATLALLFFAGEIIRPFAWVMTFGIFTGTFSSIYVAGALLIWIERKWPRGTSTDIKPPSSQGKSGKPPARPTPAGAGSR
ncbi:MAG TPA: protein translocase subunit SecF [Gemmatimonadaceae bacterium]|nr:protein translocase subunit SecF [Gemmatimonadaceae bacterium]